MSSNNPLNQTLLADQSQPIFTPPPIPNPYEIPPDAPPEAASTPNDEALNDNVSSSKIELYNVIYKPVDICQWTETDPNFRTKHSDRFWGDSFTYSIQEYSDKVKYLTNVNSKIFLGIFLVNLIVTFVSSLYVILRPKVSFDTSTANGYPILVFCIYLIVHVFLMFLFPTFWLNYGTYFSFGLSLIFMIVACVYSYFYSILLFVLIVVCGFIVSFFSKYNIEYSSYLIQFTKETKLYLSPTFVLFMIFTIVFSLLFIYAYAHSILSYCTKFFNFYLVISYWYIMNTICNAFYMAIAFTSTSYYFTCNTMDEIKFPILFGLKRAFTYNLGIASKMALLLPFVEWIKVCARIDPNLFSCPKREAFVNIISRIQRTAAKIAKKIDSLFGYPSRLGMIYSSMFGIPIEEGCQRYAERSSRHFINLFFEDCIIGNHLAFTCLVIAISGCYTVHSIASHKLSAFVSIDNLGSYAAASFSGFFLCFALSQLYRSLIRGIYEGLLIAYSEDPTRLAILMPASIYDSFNLVYSSLIQIRMHRNNSQTMHDSPNAQNVEMPVPPPQIDYPENQDHSYPPVPQFFPNEETQESNPECLRIHSNPYADINSNV